MKPIENIKGFMHEIEELEPGCGLKRLVSKYDAFFLIEQFCYLNGYQFILNYAYIEDLSRITVYELSVIKV